MRTEGEVLAEIDWRKKEVESIKTEISDKTYRESDLDYMQSRIWNLTVAIEWCEWFLNNK